MPPSSQTDRSKPQDEQRATQARDSASTLAAHFFGMTATINFCDGLTTFAGRDCSRSTAIARKNPASKNSVKNHMSYEICYCQAPRVSALGDHSEMRNLYIPQSMLGLQPTLALGWTRENQA